MRWLDGITDSMDMSLSDFPGSSDGKASAYNAGDPCSIPGSGRCPGEGNGNPLQYFCLENSMDRRLVELSPTLRFGGYLLHQLTITAD